MPIRKLICQNLGVYNESMISRTLVHYLLAFSVLFASCVSVVHSNAHIEFELAAEIIETLDAGHAEHEVVHKHSTLTSKGSDFFDGKHSIEPLCEKCLTLSLLGAYAASSNYVDFSTEKTKYQLSAPPQASQRRFSHYSSRAPPQPS